MLTWLDEHSPLPPGRTAMGPDDEVPGLVAAGGQVTPERLEEAYRKGIFPWYSAGQPVLWWSPDPRMVLPVADFKLSRSLRKTLRRFVQTPGNELRVDSAFDRVIRACADAPRDGQDGTWIGPAMLDAYIEWHARGRVHSVETWVDGELVGGLYGIAIGRMFFGESMFSHATDASKIALAGLICLCREHGLPLIDCQQNTRHLASFGAREISRADFEARLQLLVPAADIRDWTYHPSLWRHLLETPENDSADPARTDP
ncbi:MAG: leucyl/phenylalanyl-tRNA--protein transferase [Rubrivivax sp.]|nr:leucyl/phenylalanyl-tRNA--protein transferase [Rubrivivax sp.]